MLNQVNKTKLLTKKTTMFIVLYRHAHSD